MHVTFLLRFVTFLKNRKIANQYAGCYACYV
jgi:hypothetical protein